MRLSQHLIAPLKALLWQRLTDLMHLSWTLSSGIQVRVRNYADWCTYNEIFVNGEYDEAIQGALETCGDVLTALDLGANAGYFSLRLADCVRRGASPTPSLKIALVEANRGMAEEARVRTELLTQFNIDVKVHHGLVGKRTGTASLILARENNQNFVGSSDVDIWKQRRGSVNVSYLDLEGIMGAPPIIDLVKCDIEGSEFEFFKNYPDLLQKVRHLVVEFHPSFGDVGLAKELLSRAGLECCRELRNGGNTSVEYFRSRLLAQKF